MHLCVLGDISGLFLLYGNDFYDSFMTDGGFLRVVFAFWGNFNGCEEFYDCCFCILSDFSTVDLHSREVL